MFKFLHTIILLMLVSTVLNAEILKVPEKFSTIQHAIDAALEGDTVLVAKGVYKENLVIDQDIVLSSYFMIDPDSSFITETIIDGDSVESVISIEYGTSNDCFIQYLTITNGFASQNTSSNNGAGIRASGNPVIRGNIIEKNWVTNGYGAGISANSDSAIIYQNTIRYNSAVDSASGFSSGGGISASNCLIVENKIYGNFASSRGGGVYGARYTLRNNLIYDNTCPQWGAGAMVNIGKAEIVNNVIFNNHGDGIYVWSTTQDYRDTVYITNNTVANNSEYAIKSSGRIRSYAKNNILWNNNAGQTDFTNNAIAVFSYNLIQNGVDSSGNISDAPLFVDTLAMNYQLADGSPGIDQGDPDIIYDDLCFPPSKGTSRNDMGAFGGPHICPYEVALPKPTVNLIAYYPFNGNINDESGYGNNGTNNGAILTTDRFGNPDAAYEFDGSSSYISIPSSASLKSPTKELTIMAWVYMYGWSNVGDPFAPVIMKSNSATNAFQYRMALGTSGISMSLNNWNTGAASDSLVNFNEWRLVGFTFEKDTVRFYQDGKLINTKVLNITIVADDRPLELGRDVPGITEVFNGKIDDVRIYNRALDSQEMQSFYTPVINYPPNTFSLLSPSDGDTVQSVSDSLNFLWQASIDDNGDDLSYTFRLFDSQFDTTISSLSDTILSFMGDGILQKNKEYQWTVLASDGLTNVSADTFTFYTPVITSIDEELFLSAPISFELNQNYPNPFNPQTTIKYKIPKEDKVKIILFDINGREIKTLVNKRQQAGSYNYKLNASDLPSGIYFYNLQTATGYNQTRKMVLIK